MTDTPLQPASPIRQQGTALGEGEMVPGKQKIPRNHLVDALVVFIGMVTGIIAALFVGLFAGWIEITC